MSSADATPNVCTLIVDATPPSLNKIGMRGNFYARNRVKHLWQTYFEMLLMAHHAPRGCQGAHATASLRFPTQRRRDTGNFSWLLEKALGDALVNGGWLVDDTHDRFLFGPTVIESEHGENRTVITIMFSGDKS